LEGFVGALLFAQSLDAPVHAAATDEAARRCALLGIRAGANTGDARVDRVDSVEPDALAPRETFTTTRSSARSLSVMKVKHPGQRATVMVITGLPSP
jgi:hypothetical protein